MRKITEKAHEAFTNKQNFKSGNTRVEVINGEVYMSLFGNDIARTDKGDILISDGNYPASNTTCDRLSAFSQIRIRKLNDHFIINEKFKLNRGEWLNINQLENN